MKKIDEKTTFIPRGQARAFFFTVMAYWLGIAFFAPIVFAIHYGDIRWLAISPAALYAIKMLEDRKLQNDELSWLEKRESNGYADTPDKIETIRPLVNASENSNHFRYGKFSYTGEKWKELAIILLRNEWKFTRDVVATASLVPNITSNWPTLLAEFTRLGLVRDNRVTSQGRVWFYQFIPYPNALYDAPSHNMTDNNGDNGDNEENGDDYEH